MKSKLIALAAAGLMVLNASTAMAQDEKGMSPAMIQQLELVNRLVALGDARKDPLLLLAAASIQKSMGTDTATLPTQSTAPEEIIARAKGMAGGRKDIAAIADEVGAAKPKGASWRIDAVTGRATYRF
jgi:hypothetical protein